MTTDSIRVLALAIFRRADEVLLARGTDPISGESFYRPLGGGVEVGERAAAALCREIQEELGAEISDPSLLGVLENLFEYAGRPRHEIVFVFHAQFVDPSWYERRDLAVIEAGAGWEEVRWISLEVLAAGTYQLVPSGLLPLLAIH